MPGFYNPDEYDLAGFAVGIVDKDKIIDGRTINDGDVLIGLASSGIHSNGYSLVRKIFFEDMGYNEKTYIRQLGDTLGNILLKPTRIYKRAVIESLGKVNIKGMCHITGGGFFENIPRIIPDGLGVEISLGSWDIPPIFNIIQNLGNIDRVEMFKTFNMGIGYIFVVSEGEAEDLFKFLHSIGEKAYKIGRVVKGFNGVNLCQN